MSVPAELLAQLSQAGPGAPAVAPAPREGDRAVAQTFVRAAMSILQKSLTLFGPGSDEAMTLYDVLKRLATQFGSSEPLPPQELQNLIAQHQAVQQKAQ